MRGKVAKKLPREARRAFADWLDQQRRIAIAAAQSQQPEAVNAPEPAPAA